MAYVDLPVQTASTATNTYVARKFHFFTSITYFQLLNTIRNTFCLLMYIPNITDFFLVHHLL